MQTEIITIVGARPQFIKAATISQAINKVGPGIRERILHTGQHFDDNMSKVFFEALSIPSPTWNLAVGGGTHGQNTGRMIEGIEQILNKCKPDHVLIFGDTDSTLAGAIAASKIGIPVSHIEAGLRSFNRRMPEEINRVVSDHVSQFLFTPTATATGHLIREGINPSQIHQVGDVMYDIIKNTVGRKIFNGKKTKCFDHSAEKYILATLHRGSNVDNRERLIEIVDIFRRSPSNVIWPMHPRTKSRLADLGINMPNNITVMEPADYFTMQSLIKSAILVVTDSGGVQKEACFHQVPCIVVRTETEWPELIDSGHSRLCGSRLPEVFAPFPIPSTDASAPFGNGDAAEKIIKILLE